MTEWFFGVFFGFIIGAALVFSFFDSSPITPDYYKFVSRLTICNVIQDKDGNEYYYFNENRKEVKIKKQ